MKQSLGGFRCRRGHRRIMALKLTLRGCIHAGQASNLPSDLFIRKESDSYKGKDSFFGAEILLRFLVSWSEVDEEV
jgi:hypothetical protein